MYSPNIFSKMAASSARKCPMDKKKTQLVEIVGEDAVVENPYLGAFCSLDHTLIPPLRSHLLVRPRNVDDVQHIVLWANETQTPLVPVSSGPPHFRGDTLPTAPEAVIVDLSRMNRVLRVDRRNRLVLIEPGVTYGQLQSELQKYGLRVIMPLLPRQNKSVLAALLEREPPISPRYHWNMLEPLRSLEIVWGNGDKLYSGSGIYRGETDEDWLEGRVPVWGPGPGQLDYYRLLSASQGTLGIATWASVKCEVLPQVRKLFLVPAARLEDLLDFTYKLLRFRFGDELFIVNNTALAMILARRPEGVPTLRDILPAWAVVVGVTGGEFLPAERVQAQESDIRDIAQEFGLSLTPAVPGCRGGDLLKILLEPSAEPYWKIRSKGGMQEIFFLTPLERTPGFVATMLAAANDHQYPAPDVGIYLQPVHQGVGCHCEFILPFDPRNRAEVARARELFHDASVRLFHQKAYFSRPYGIWAPMVYNADAQATLALRKVKDIFDPSHVMNPGKLCF
jgi:FAD/FMN-containing dehydrogenase